MTADMLAASTGERDFGGMFVCIIVLIIVLAAIKSHHDNQSGR